MYRVIMDFKEETNALNQISIQIVASWLGLKLPARGTVRCPFDDHTDSNPSFEVKTSGNRWICYGCNRSGGSIDFVKTYNSLSFLDAKRWLAAQAAVGSPALPRRQIIASSQLTNPSQNDDGDETPPDYEVYEKLLQLAPLQQRGRQYLSERGISSNTIANFKIGQLNKNKAVLSELLRIYGFERLKDAGLLTQRSSPQNVRLLFQNGSLLFPFYESGSLTYMQARVIERTDIRFKWLNLNSRKRRIYNVDALLDKKAGNFAICEGIMDTLSAVELDYSGVGLIGVNTKFSNEQLIQLRGKHVDILLDWDPAGETKAQELQQTLRRFGIPSTRKSRPSANANDLNEYLMELRIGK